MSVVDYRQPWFNLKLPRSIISKIARLTFPGEIRHPHDEAHVLTNEEFVSPVYPVLDDDHKLHISYEVKPADEGSMVIHEGMDYEGMRVSARVPDDQCSAGYSYVMGALARIEEPLADRMLRAAIEEGRAPRALEQTFLSIDFRVSAHAALELGASMWQLPNLDTLASDAPFGELNEETNEMEFEWHRAPLPIARKVEFKTKDEAEAANDYFMAIQDLIFDILDRFPDNKKLVHQLLPLGIVVDTTVVKTIAEWRNFIVSDSQSFEAFYLKKQLFLQADRVASCLFAGCEKVVAAFDSHEARLKEKV